MPARRPIWSLKMVSPYILLFYCPQLSCGKEYLWWSCAWLAWFWEDTNVIGLSFRCHCDSGQRHCRCPWFERRLKRWSRWPWNHQTPALCWHHLLSRLHRQVPLRPRSTYLPTHYGDSDQNSVVSCSSARSTASAGRMPRTVPDSARSAPPFHERQPQWRGLHHRHHLQVRGLAMWSNG